MSRQPTLTDDGFSLIEMAVVLVILGLILSSSLLPLSAQMDHHNTLETQKNLAEAREALLGFAMAHGYLPCPAKSASDGLEDRTGNTCTGGKRVGHLPWAELVMAKLDGWGHLFRYSVTLAYADSGSKIVLSPLTNRDITIESRDAAGNLQNLSTAGGIPVAIVSMGKNGIWGYADDGSRVSDTSSTNTDEDSNGNGNGKVFMSRTPAENTTAPGGEFDDLVVWVSPGIYLNRMVAAGQLP